MRPHCHLQLAKVAMYKTADKSFPNNFYTHGIQTDKSRILKILTTNFQYFNTFKLKPVNRLNNLFDEVEEDEKPDERGQEDVDGDHLKFGHVHLVDSTFECLSSFWRYQTHGWLEITHLEYRVILLNKLIKLIRVRGIRFNVNYWLKG